MQQLQEKEPHIDLEGKGRGRWSMPGDVLLYLEEIRDAIAAIHAFIQTKLDPLEEAVAAMIRNESA